jgi:hypothetical protein
MQDGNPEIEETVETPTEEESKEEMVPKSRLDEVQATLEAEKEAAAQQAQQYNLILAQQQQNSKSKDQAPDIFKELGIEDDEDVLTVGQHRKLINHQMQLFGSLINDLQFQVSHPDFTELCGTMDQIRAGQWAQPLKDAIMKNPALMTTITSSANPKEAAYQIAKTAVKKADKTVDTTEAEEAIKKAAEDAGKIKSTSNVKAAATLSEKGRYDEMDDEEFLKLAAKNGAIF